MMHRILLVDDEQNILNALKRELQDTYEVEACNTPSQALQRCRETSFDLVIADYLMPDMNGIQFLKQFEKLQPQAMRLILSGQADTSVLIRAINETHIHRFIDKPWDQAELASTLAQALAYRKAVLENSRLNQSPYEQQDLLRKLQEPGRRFQILAVDDEPNILNAVVRDLTSRSAFQDLQQMLHAVDQESSSNHVDLRFDVFKAESPIQALDYAESLSCDVVIVDYLMQEMNGMELVQQFRTMHPDAVFIMLSGHADKQMVSTAINRLEIFSFISKPWRENELRNAVTQAVIYSALLQENRMLATEKSAVLSS